MDPVIGLVIIAALLAIFIWWLRSRGPATQAGWRRRSGPDAGLAVVCTQGPLAGKRFRFQRDWMSFGRQPDNDVVIDGNLVSRNHAVVKITPQGLVLSDLGSTNGTWVSGRRVLEQPLALNETYQIGPCVFAVTQTAAAAAASQPPIPSAPPISVAPPAPVSPAMARSVEINAYDRLELIGDGGAAYVYKLRHRQTSQLAALKVLKESADPYFKNRFPNEGIIGRRLKHPNIVEVLDASEVNGISYILMEYLEGGSLRERLPGRLDLAQTLAVAGQMCQALDSAHDQGVFHRDIKPENILFTRNGVAKLGDFGIARLTGMRRITREGMIIGTPEYMSFEQAKGLEHVAQSDQYSLGVVLYEMLTGRPPFTAENPLSIVEKHLSEKPTPIRRINPNVPADVERAIMRTLSKDKGQRFTRMADLAAALGCAGAPRSRAISRPPNRPQSVPAGQARLVREGTGQSWVLTMPAEIGRAMIGDPTISGRHALIRKNGRVYTIEDLNSTNGTFVEGQRISAITVLSPGARIHLGPVSFHFLVDEPPAFGWRLS